MTDSSIGDRIQNLLAESFDCLLELPLEQLPDTCEAISERIESATEALLFEELLRLRGYHGKKPSFPNRDYMCIRSGLPYVFSAQPGPRGTETFCLTIICADAERSKPQPLEPPLPLSETTPFKRLVTQTELGTVNAAKHLSALCKESLDTGYHWLEEFCIDAVEKDKNLIIDELYRIVRSAVPDHCTESIWLYMLVKRGSVYVLDKIAQKTILKRSREISSRFEKAPVDTMVRLAGRICKPEHTSDFRRVIPQDKTYINDPLHGISEGDSIALPQYILFGGQNHCIQPLVGKESGALDENAVWLTAVYSIPMRESIERPLSQTRPKLAKILKDHRGIRRSIIRKLKRAPIVERLAPYSDLLAPFFREGLKAVLTP